MNHSGAKERKYVFLTSNPHNAEISNHQKYPYMLAGIVVIGNLQEFLCVASDKENSSSVVVWNM